AVRFELERHPRPPHRRPPGNDDTVLFYSNVAKTPRPVWRGRQDAHTASPWRTLRPGARGSLLWRPLTVWRALRLGRGRRARLAVRHAMVAALALLRRTPGTSVAHDRRCRWLAGRLLRRLWCRQGWRRQVDDPTARAAQLAIDPRDDLLDLFAEQLFLLQQRLDDRVDLRAVLVDQFAGGLELL